MRHQRVAPRVALWIVAGLALGCFESHSTGMRNMQPGTGAAVEVSLPLKSKKIKDEGLLPPDPKAPPLNRR
jgi:hypothetical protein